MRRIPARLAIALTTLSATACGAGSAVPAATSNVAVGAAVNGEQPTALFSAPPSMTPGPSAPAVPAASLGVDQLTATPPPDPLSVLAGGPDIGGCQVFPADNPWNQDISSAPVDPNSATYIARIDSFRQFLHPDFGSNPSYGIPYVVVPGSQPMVPITFDAYGDESDPGPYPVPLNAPVEAGSDHHVLVLDSGNCTLYEMYAATQQGVGWTCASGAVFHLNSNALRPDGWTSADAAGLPILPGLVTYDEVASGVISHALRFTVDQTQNGFIHPATHEAGVADASDPPMGMRLRLKASFDLSPFHGEALVIL
ncbi:MAG: hypothetical protein JOZ92_10260, partial [Candidatus Dormibacteraeota bacterium]|nr:hypothetical protein [Candidatus Dormibacteraeota bacterium]